VRTSHFQIGDRGLNEGGPPSTFEYNEHERKQGDDMYSRRVVATTQKRKQIVLPTLTDAQIAARAKQIAKAMRMMVEAFSMEPLDARWSNRLMQAHTHALQVMEDAARWQEEPQTVGSGDQETKNEG
jgi:hypothetical protein